MREETMRRFVFALLGATATSGAALAADMPVKAPPRILPPPILVYNWTGCYIGGHAGGGGGRTEWINTENTTAFGEQLSD
jgi:outer membrane immunogenic protein